MKFLLVTHQFFPDHSAGTEVLTRSVARELIARGQTVRIMTGYPGSASLADELRADEYEYEGMHVYRFHHAYTPMGDQRSMIEVGYDNRLAAEFFAKILDEFQPDIVHFFHLNRLGTGLIEESVRHGVPCFMTPTDFWSICTTAQLVYPDGSLCSGPSADSGNCVKHFAQSNSRNEVVRSIARNLPVPAADLLVRLTRRRQLPPYPLQVEVDALGERLHRNVRRLNHLQRIVAPNQFMQKKLVEHGVHAELVVCSAFGIELPAMNAPIRGSEKSRPVQIGFIGTLAPHKGSHVLLEAFRSLPEADAVLRIYGNANEFPDYAAQLSALAAGDARIELSGVFPNTKIAEVMAGLDVLVVPSLWYENTPLVIYSAQASRCVVVASNHPGISEVVRDNVTGLLFEPGDVQGLAGALKQVISDPDLLARLSANTVQPKSIGTYVDELAEIWRTSSSP